MSDEMNGSMVVGDFIVDDGCSICLEPFTSLNPASVTKCNHQYHLQCILEWSRRRSLCPVCSQHLVLKDPASQEMVAAATRENESKTKQSNRENEHPTRARERLMRRRAAAPSARTIMIARRRRLSTNPDPFHCFPTTVPPLSAAPAATPADARRSRSTELVSFSESLKSKLSTASIRYRESFSKGIAGIAKLISRRRGRASRSRHEAGSVGYDSMVEPTERS